MSETALALFETAAGTAGIAWSKAGVRASAFPGPDGAAVRRQLARRTPDAAEIPPPTEIAAVIAGFRALFEGAAASFDGVALDLSGVADFDVAVYRETRRVPCGATATYGAIARALGDAALAQRVGQALARNPVPVIVPCHRVVGAGGRLVGFSAPGGLAAKERLLKLEGGLARGLFD